jgi:hypothetical protein
MKPTLPSAWADLLFRLHSAGFPEAIIAGGALRDLVNDKPVKAIDIFVSDHNEVTVNGNFGLILDSLEEFHHRLAKAIGDPNWSYTVSRSAPEYLESMDDQVVEVLSFNAPGITLPVQVVVLKDASNPWEVLKRIDFGICQIGHNGKATLATPEYTIDKVNHSFTLCRCESKAQMARSMQRYERLSAKYPDWELVVPDHMMQFFPGQG